VPARKKVHNSVKGRGEGCSEWMRAVSAEATTPGVVRDWRERARRIRKRVIGKEIKGFIVDGRGEL